MPLTFLIWIFRRFRTLFRLTSGRRRIPEYEEEMETLQKLSFLLRSGYPASARVVEVVGYDELHSSQVGHVDLLLDLQMPGRPGSCRVRTATMLSPQRIPRAGEMISVKYLPTDTSCVVVL